MKIENKKISDVKPYQKNPRIKKDIKIVADSIKQFGWQQPIVVDRSGVIIVGHSRYEAAKLLKCESIPVLIADLSPEKAKAYRIADNKTNEFSEWDYKFLHKEFADLLDVNFDLELTGFNSEELENIITFEKDIEEGLPDLKSGNKEPFQQMTFNLHDSQIPIIESALNYIKNQKIDNYENENKNANALTQICKIFNEKFS